MKLQKCSQSDGFQTPEKFSSCNMKLAVLGCMNPMNSVFSEEGKKECVACYAFVWLYLPALLLINEHVILSALNPVNILY